MNVTIEQQIAAAAREIALRRNVYPGFVARGKMTQEKASAEIAAMEAVIETLKAERWIPVDERKPDDDVTVMIATKSGNEPIVWLGYYDGDCWCNVDEMPLRTGVTHWRPMPEAPR